MKRFDENIKALINLLEYDMWTVIPDFHIKCVCQNFETGQSDCCPYCLGTGYKIKIKRIKGVRQPKRMDAQSGGFKDEVGVYFLKPEYTMKIKSYIVWHDEVEEVARIERHCSDAQKSVYYRIETVPKKTGVEKFLKYFHKLIDNVRK